MSPVGRGTHWQDVFVRGYTIPVYDVISVFSADAGQGRSYALPLAVSVVSLAVGVVSGATGGVRKSDRGSKVPHPIFRS